MWVTVNWVLNKNIISPWHNALVSSREDFLLVSFYGAFLLVSFYGAFLLVRFYGAFLLVIYSICLFAGAWHHFKE